MLKWNQVNFWIIQRTLRFVYKLYNYTTRTILITMRGKVVSRNAKWMHVSETTVMC